MAVATQFLATPEELDEREERAEALRGYKLTPQVEALDTIFRRAIHHDSLCQLSNDKAYRDLRHKGRTDDANYNTSRLDAVELCAALAAAALRRIPESTMLARGLASALDSDEDGELDAFLRPIFVESGLGDRYERRCGCEVYPPVD